MREHCHTPPGIELVRLVSDISPLPPDLPRLQAIATYLQLELERVQRRMAEVEQWEAARRASTRPAVPPEWALQMDIGADPQPVAVHHGQCTTASAPCAAPGCGGSAAGTRSRPWPQASNRACWAGPIASSGSTEECHGAPADCHEVEEVEGLQVSLAGTEEKLRQLDRGHRRHAAVDLGIPTTRGDR